MEQPIHVDLLMASFDDFISFLFDRDDPPDPEGRDRWYYHVQVEFDAQKVCSHYIQLFRHPEFVLTRFTIAQIEEGFWAIQAPNLDCSASNLILESDLSPSLREECIRSMADLFERLFSKEGFDTSEAVSMWWEILSATTGIVETEIVQTEGKTRGCRIFSFTRCLKSFHPIPRLAKEPRSMV